MIRCWKVTTYDQDLSVTHFTLGVGSTWGPVYDPQPYYTDEAVTSMDSLPLMQSRQLTPLRFGIDIYYYASS